MCVSFVMLGIVIEDIHYIDFFLFVFVNFVCYVLDGWDTEDECLKKQDDLKEHSAKNERESRKAYAKQSTKRSIKQLHQFERRRQDKQNSLPQHQQSVPMDQPSTSKRLTKLSQKALDMAYKNDCNKPAKEKVRVKIVHVYIVLMMLGGQ